MAARCFRIIELVVLLYLIRQISSTVELTNVKCTSLDPKFLDFEYCYLKSVNRTYKYLSLKTKISSFPLRKPKVNVEILKRFNGYKPFLYNLTVDICRFMKNPKSNPVAVYLHDSFKNYSNINHTCPLDHDFIVDRLPISFLNLHLTQVLPFPIGDYLFQWNGFTDGINRGVVKLYLTLS